MKKKIPVRLLICILFIFCIKISFAQTNNIEILNGTWVSQNLFSIWEFEMEEKKVYVEKLENGQFDEYVYESISNKIVLLDNTNSIAAYINIVNEDQIELFIKELNHTITLFKIQLRLNKKTIHQSLIHQKASINNYFDKIDFASDSTITFLYKENDIAHLEYPWRVDSLFEIVTLSLNLHPFLILDKIENGYKVALLYEEGNIAELKFTTTDIENNLTGYWCLKDTTYFYEQANYREIILEINSNTKGILHRRDTSHGESHEEVSIKYYPHVNVIEIKTKDFTLGVFKYIIEKGKPKLIELDYYRHFDQEKRYSQNLILEKRL